MTRTGRTPQQVMDDALWGVLAEGWREGFGAHAYERVDRPRGQFFHTNWTGHGGDATSNPYQA